MLLKFNDQRGWNAYHELGEVEHCFNVSITLEYKKYNPIILVVRLTDGWYSYLNITIQCIVQ